VHQRPSPGGADVLLIETTQDTRNLKAGLIGVEQAMTEVAAASANTAVAGSIRWIAWPPSAPSSNSRTSRP